MNKNIAFLLTLVAAGMTHSGTVSAAISYDQNVTPDVIFGSGVSNGSFTVDRNNGIELGLRGKLRHNAAGNPENTYNSNGDGTYSFDAGVAPGQSSPTAVWSFEWSINTDFDGSTGLNVGDLTYALGLDEDPSQDTSFTVFDPIFDLGGLISPDHSFGNNSTGNGNGAEAWSWISMPFFGVTGYNDLIADNNVAQNSWKPHWYFTSFDPTVDGTYDIYLAAFDASGAQRARTEIQIIVGNGAAADVPEPATLALMCLGLGLAGVGYGRQRSRRNA